jgi:hypothetical protein
MVALGVPYAFYCGQALATIRYDSFLHDTPVDSLYMVRNCDVFVFFTPLHLHCMLGAMLKLCRCAL